MVRNRRKGWTSGVLAVGIGLLALSAASTPNPRAGDIPEEALKLAGAWDITVYTPHGGKAYSWLEIEPSGATLVGRFVGQVGSARPLSKIEYSQGNFHFTMPPQYESRELHFDGNRLLDQMTGIVRGYADAPCAWIAHRAPALKREHPPNWGKPIPLFNGKNLDGWNPQGGENHWTVNQGLLANLKGGANLVTTDKFEDFKLHAEFRIPPDSNSGLYLRGRYEVQIENDEGRELNTHSIGGIYGFFAPCVNVAKKPGEWQTFDITLVGRMVTVVFNGETIIDRQTIPGITGGALDCNEGKPGPLMIQGDHGAIEFRKIVLTPGDTP